MDWKENSMIEWLELGKFAIVQKTKNKKHVTENAYSITQAGLVPTKSFFKEKTNVTSGNTSGYYIVEKNWFVYSPSRIDVGSISYLKDEGPVIVSPIDVVFSIDINKCLPSYLLNYFFTYDGKKALLKNREGVEGMGRRNLPFDAIKSVLVPLPSLSEQTRIVGILDTFTAAIENLKQQIAERRKQYEYYRNELLDLEGKEGVEMKMIGEMYKPITPPKKLNTAEYLNHGLYPIIDQGQKSIVGYTNDETALVSNREYVLFGDHTRIVKYYKGQFAQGADGLKILVPIVNASCRFLYFALSNVDVPSRGYSRHWSIAKEILIPIPSIEEQYRIVSILDTFEATIANLEAQLKEREKQYEYYRNKLLTFE